MTSKDEKLHVKIGIKIALERKKRKLSQEKFSEMADISKTYLSAIENGTSVPSIETLNKIAQAFNMQITELVDVTKVDL